MRLDELKRIAEENNYGYFGVKGGFYDFRRERDGALISISISELNNILLLDLDSCCGKDLRMLKATIEFAETPPDEREEEKKYTYKHERLKTKGGNWSYLAIRQRPSISYPILQRSDVDIHEYKVEFTDEEIEEYKKEFGINLDHYIKEEARQENL